MLLHPEVQQRAQSEIDAVVGRDRLPDLNDRESLPYVQCVVNEVMRSVSIIQIKFNWDASQYVSRRWQPVTPFGLPHRLMEDDTYNGMFLPKGSVLIANTSYVHP